MSLQTFPKDLLGKIVSHLVVDIGPFKAIYLRTVNKLFDDAVWVAFTSCPALDVDNPATTHTLPYWLKGKILLAKLAKLEPGETDENKFLEVLSNVTFALEEMTTCVSPELLLMPERKKQWDEAVAEAIGRLYPGHSAYDYSSENAAANKHSQAFLSGAIIADRAWFADPLLRQGAADANADNPHFGRPLQLAAAWGHLHAVEYLLCQGADPRAVSLDCERDRSLSGMDVSLGLLLDGPNLHRNRSPQGSALRAAALGGHQDIVRLLLQAEYRLTPACGHEYFRPLVAAARGGHLHIIGMLTDALSSTGSLMGLPSYVRQHMFWEAVWHGKLDVVDMLLDSGAAGVNKQLPHGHEMRDAMEIATQRKDTAMVDLLLKHGANA